MPKPQPIYRNEFIVKKNEKISWNLEEPWLAQLDKHVNFYLNNKRSKSKDHKLFSLELEKCIKEIKKSPINQSVLISSKLLPLLQERPKLVEKGWGGKSYLFALCQFAAQQFYIHKAIDSVRERNNQSLAEEQQRFSLLADENNALKQSIDDLKEEFSRQKELLSKELATAFTINEDLMRDLQKKQQETDELHQQLAITKSQNEYFTQQINNKNKEIEKLNKSVEEQKIKREENKIETTASTKQVENADLMERIRELEKENKRLSQENEAIPLLKAEQDDLVLYRYKVLHDNHELLTNLTTAKQELTRTTRIMNYLIDFVDKIFGNTLGDKAINVFSKLTYIQPPISDVHIKYIQHIVSTTANEKLAKEVDEMAEKIKNGVEEPPNFSQKISASLSNSLAFFGKKISSPDKKVAEKPTSTLNNG